MLFRDIFVQSGNQLVKRYAQFYEENKGYSTVVGLLITEEAVHVWRGGGIWEISVPFSQFCGESRLL